VSELLDSIALWAEGLAGTPWVFLAVYAFATIDGFFPPIPSESVVIALGSLNRSAGVPNLPLVLLFAALGAFTGDQIAYQIGKKINVRGLRFMRSERAQAALDWAERSLERRGASFIIAARYVPIGRVAVNMTAGAVGYHRPRFMGLTAIAAVTWACYSALIGIASGSLLEGRPILAIALGVVGGIILGVIVDRIIQWLTTRKDRPVAPAPSPTVASPADDGAPEVTSSPAAGTVRDDEEG